MRTARRAYLYAVSFISLQAVLWATIGLGRLLLFSGIPRGLALLAPAIAGYLSVLIVGGPFCLIHWLIAQHLALQDSEERGAAFRSFFHYSLMTSTAIPGLLALQQAVHYVASNALGIAEPQPYLGYVQSLPVFLLQAAVMGVAWACAWRLAAGDAHALPESGLRGSLHRLYRYILATFGIALTASAAGMLLTLLLETGSEAISLRKGQLAIGLAQAVVGVPIWTLTWGILQRAFAVGGEETESTIRRVYQHLMCFVGSLGTIVACAGVLTMLLQSALRISQAPGPMLAQLARPLAVASVGAVLWAYHAHILAREAAGESGSPAQRTYHYLTATLGLGSALIGAIFLVDAIGPALSGMWSPGLRVSLCNGLATLAAGLPVWLVSWMRMQSLAWKPDEHAEVERRAAVRRGYLYLVAFAGAIGLLAALASLISFLLSRVLGGDLDTSFDGGSRALLAAFLFAALLGYHLHVIRADGRLERRSRAEVLAEFPIALVGPEPWTARFRATLSHSLPGIPIREHPSNDLLSALADTRAVLFPASLLATWPDAERSRLSSYEGLRLPVPENEPQWGWVGLVDRSQPWQAEQAARAIELAAFGEPVRSPRAMSPWAVAGGVIMLVVLIPIAIALIVALISLAGIR